MPSDIQPADEERGIPLDTLRNFFRGTVVDEKTKELLTGAVIRLDSSNIGAIAEMNGKFTVRIPAHLVTDILVFIISFVDYETKTIHAGRTQLISDVEEVYLLYEMQASTTLPSIDSDPPYPKHEVGLIMIKKR